MLPLVSLALAAPVVDPFTEPDDSELYRLEERIVTVAARYAQTVQDAPGIVTVITDRELRERGFRTLAEALRSLPGVYISTANESRRLAWFRGTIAADNSKVLLLVDGQPWYDGVYTHAWIDDYLPLENVRQIEIIKGPGSAIYGTNAFSGVINVVTYTPSELHGGFARVIAGTSARHGISAVAGQPFEVAGVDAGVVAYARWFDTNSDGLGETPKGRRNVSGTDPKRAINAGLRLDVGGLDLRFDATEYRHTYFVNEQDDPLDVAFQSADDYWLQYHDQFARASYTAHAGAVEIVPRMSWQRHEDPGQYGWFSDPETILNEEGAYETTWKTTLVETFKTTELWNGGVDLTARIGAANVLVAGVGGELNHVVRIEDVTYADLSHDPVAGESYYAPETWIADGFVYAQDTLTALSFLKVTAGARLDYHQFFGPFVSPRLGVLLVPSSSAVVKVLYGRAFRAPTARELLVAVSKDPETGENRYTAGNPDLAPETIDTIETELTAQPARGVELRFSAYYSALAGEINKLSEPVSPTLGDLYYTNVGGSDVVGGEAQGTVTVGAFVFDASYSYTHATDRDSGNVQYEFPPHMAHGRAGWNLADVLRATVSVDAFGERPREEWTPDSKRPDGEAFALLNLALATDAIAGGRVRLDASLTNVLDTKYATLVYRDDANRVDFEGAANYPRDVQGEGRALQVGVEVAF